FVVPVFSPRDDPIACLNKAMAFLTVIAFSRFPSTNNQLKTSSNPRNQATIQDNRVTVQQARVVKCYNCQGEGHIARQCTQRKRPRNVAWYKEKAMLAEAQEVGQILDEEQLVFLVDPGIPAGQAQTIIPHKAAFQTEDPDTYDSNCDDLSTAQAILMANIFNYGSDIISEVPNSKTYLNDMDNQSMHALQDFKQSPVMDFTDNEISSDSNIIPYSQYLQETQQATVQDTNLQAQQDSMILSVIEQIREKMIDSQMDDMIREKLALKEQVDSLEQNLSKQIKEKESVLQTFTVFKNESKEKENKYMENEIDLEKKIKELDNIICKVGQSAQTVHMLTKPQAFYDNTHKQALGYQNPFYLKKAQRIKPTLYDGVVMSNAHVAMPMIDDEETLILEEESRSKMSKKQRILKFCEYGMPRVFKDQFDSIKQTRVRHKDQCDSLINKLNIKSVENEDLKAQIQDKVFVITSLKNDLRKLKWKEIVENVVHTISATTSAPGMFKLDLVPLPPRLLQNRDAHIDYLRHTQEQANTLREIVSETTFR
ncbi:retrovirus-related pol polyprotein from transposon TNT 1-94, partial [Tanacetum coccineum]